MLYPYDWLLSFFILILVAHQHLTLLAFSLSYLDCVFIVFLLIFLISHYFFIIFFFLLNNNLFIVFTNLIFWGAFTREGFTCFLYATVYFLSIAEHFVTKTLVYSSSIIFCTPIFQYQCLVSCHTHRPIFHGVLVAVISWISSDSSISDLTLSFCCSSTFNLSSILTFIAF